MQRHIWLAVPAYTGTVHIATVRSLMTDVLAFRERGDAITLHDETGSALIGNARASVVAKFLASDATDLVFLDHDICWEAGALLKLVDAPVDCVAGIYPHRRDPEGYSIQWLTERADLVADPATGLLEVAGVPAGFLRLSRGMLKRMVEAYPDTIFHDEGSPNAEAWGLFDPYRIGKLKMGEDFSFCRRWRDIGGQVWADPEIRMGHIGNKTFPGHLGDWLRGRPA